MLRHYRCYSGALFLLDFPPVVRHNGYMQSFTQFFLLGLLVLGGMGLTVQQAVNARLRGGVESPVLSALISFLVGGVVLAIFAALGVLGRGKLTGLGTLPWWAWTGGLLGAFYVTLAVVGVRAVGAASVIVCAVLGQVVLGLLLDAMGWLGIPKAPLSLHRVAGALLVLAGVLLVQWKR